MRIFNSFQAVYDANAHGTASVMSVFNDRARIDKMQQLQQSDDFREVALLFIEEAKEWEEKDKTALTPEQLQEWRDLMAVRRYLTGELEWAWDETTGDKNANAIDKALNPNPAPWQYGYSPETET